MKALHVISFILLVVGGLNWGLVGINPEWNVVAMLSDNVERVVYILVGVAAVLLIVTHKTSCKACVSSSAAPQMM